MKYILVEFIDVDLERLHDSFCQVFSLIQPLRILVLLLDEAFHESLGLLDPLLVRQRAKTLSDRDRGACGGRHAPLHLDIRLVYDQILQIVSVGRALRSDHYSVGIWVNSLLKEGRLGELLLVSN